MVRPGLRASAWVRSRRRSLPKTLAIPLGLALAGVGVLAGLACGRSQPSAPASTAVVGPPGPGPLVGALGFSCDRAHWRVGFTLSAPARISADLERRSGGRWTFVRRLGSLRAADGPQTLDVGTHPAGLYRASVLFTSGRTEVTRTILFRAGCTNPPPPLTTPTLPGGTSTLPFQ